MCTLVDSFQDEIRLVMQRCLNGEISEADSARTIILLQNEIISVLLSDLSSLNHDLAHGSAESRKAA